MEFKNAKMDDLINQSAAEPIYEKRVALMDEFQKEYVKELPTINTWVRTNSYGYSKDFEGWGLAPGNFGLLNSKYIVNVFKAK